MRLAFLAVLVLIAMPPGAEAGDCSHALDPRFYESNKYTIRVIELRSPFDFFFLVRQRFEAIKSRLPIKEGDPFDEDAYDQSFDVVRDAVKADSALGKDSPFKIVTTTGGLENCQEDASGPQTVDILYRIFSTDPIPAAQAAPEQRQASVERPATTAAEQTSIPKYKVVPHLDYDLTRRAFGGADFTLNIPTRFLDAFELSAAGSSSSRNIYGALRGSGNPGHAALDRVEYALAYHDNDTPAVDLRLTKGVVRGYVSSSSKAFEAGDARTRLRYGAAVEQGTQQTDLPGQSSRYGALKLYGGLTSMTRYSETVVSYGFSAGGAGLSNLDYVRHIGDAVYQRRFPGGTNRPWDIALRATAGGISGSGTVLVNDRFFGGNTVLPLVPGTSGNIPSGPLVRSIPTNRFAGAGMGGTSFYSANVTVGKVITGWPLIPDEVEKSPGFDDAVNAAENSAETWFRDDFEAASPEFKELLEHFPPRLGEEIDAARSVLASIRAAAPVDAAVAARLTQGDRFITRSKILIQTASNTALRGADRAVRLRGWLTPASSLVKLTKVMEELQPLAPSAAAQLKSAREAIELDLAALRDALQRIQTGPAHDAAAVRASQNMARPREVIDTLRHETNRYALSLVGIADAGRLSPDPYGTRYAFGGGVRVSLVTVNFTLGYAINPHPHPDVGQGRGALFFSLTYTNLFR